MESLADALWDLFEKQKSKGLSSEMRRSLQKLEQAGKKDARWCNAMGELLLLEKQFLRAAQFFQRAYEQEHKAEYQLNWSNALYYGNKYAQARDVLEVYLGEYPDDYHAFLNLANCQIHLSELGKARALCSQGLLSGKGKSLFLNTLGQIEYLSKQFEKALDHFDNAYNESSDYIDALFNRANLRLQLNRIDDAIADYQLCVRKDENFEPAFQNLALAYLGQGRAEEARHAIRKALALGPVNAVNYYLQGRIFVAEKEYRLARDSFKEAMKFDPGYWQSYTALADVYRLESQLDDTLTLLQKVMSQSDIHFEVRRECIQILFNLQAYPLCLKQIELLKTDELNDGIQFIRIYSLWKSSQTPAALKEIGNLLKIAGETPKLLTLLAMMLRESGARDLGKARLLRALELREDALEAALELASLYQEQGHIELSLQVLEAQLAFYPHNADLMYNLACCYSCSQNTHNGLDYLKKAYEYGFRDFDKMNSDKDLEELRKLEDFKGLFAEAEVI